tara:strand:- start:11409 stop:11594 length:186 start_codon:yes stop_codon:yes gene_type:complete
MKYVVNIIRTNGSTFFKKVEASSAKEAEEKARERYPSYDIGRINASLEGTKYYDLMKKMRE